MNVSSLQNMASNTTFRVIMILFFLVIIIMYLYRKYETLKKKQRMEPIFIRKPTNASKAIVVPNKSIPMSTRGTNYSMAMWLYVSSVNFKKSTYKHILHKGKKDGSVAQPGVWLDARKNNLLVRIDTYGRNKNKWLSRTIRGDSCQKWDSQFPHAHEFTKDKMGDEAYIKKELEANYCRNPNDDPKGLWCYTNNMTIEKSYCGPKTLDHVASMNPGKQVPYLQDHSEKLDIENIPIDRWFHFALCCCDQHGDVYIDGKLVKTKVFASPVKLNDGDLYITDNNGFRGMTNQFRYFSKCLGAKDIYKLYAKGLYPFMYPDLISLDKYVGKFNVGIQIQAGDKKYGGKIGGNLSTDLEGDVSGQTYSY